MYLFMYKYIYRSQCQVYLVPTIELDIFMITDNTWLL